jgi:hypothetical protein
MKKKTVSPIIYMAVIFFACMVLTVVSNYIGRASNNQPQKSRSRDIRSENQNNDFMIWESASHHLLSISR